MSLADEIKAETKLSLAEEIAAQPKKLSLADEIADVEPSKLSLAEELDAGEDKVLEMSAQGFEVPPDLMATTINRLKDKNEATDWVKVLLTPTGGYYMKLGKHIPLSSDIMKAFGVPSTFPIDPNIKYGPLLGETLKGLEKKFNLPFTQMPDRFLAGAFIDILLLKGGSKILGRMAASNLLKSAPSEQLAKTVSEWQKASPELVQFMEREIAKQELAALKAGVSFRKATSEEIVRVKEKVAEAIFSESSIAPTEITIGKTLFKYIDSEWKAIKLSNELVKLQAAKQVVDDTKIFAKATEEATKAALDVRLPPLGQADLNPFEKGGYAWYHSFSSPRYVVPELYELHSQKVRLMSKMRDKYLQPLQEFADIQDTPERAELIGKILDGVYKYPEVSKTWTNLSIKETKALKHFTDSWGELADKLFEVTRDEALRPGNRMLTYLTHIVKNYMEPQKIAVPERLRKLVTLGKRFLKKRKGAKEFSLNPFEAFDEYLSWASEKLADTIIKPQWEEVIGHYGINQASYGKWFWNNVHRVEHMPKAIKDAILGVRNNMYRATLGWNVAASLVNRTQFFVFGSSRIGWGATQRGLKLRNLKNVDNPEGQRIRDILNISGIYDDMSEFIKKSKFGERPTPLSKTIGKIVPKWASDPMHIFSQSEKFNKETVYLGAYEDILNTIKKVRKLGPSNLPQATNKLERLGVNITADAVEEAHKYAYKAMVDTQLDLSKAGQMAMTSNPVIGTMMMYSSFPIKAGEYALRTFSKATKAIGREGLAAYNHPEVQEALRFGVNVGAMGALLAGLGVSVDDIVGPTNFLAKMSPALKTLMRTWSSTLSIAENIPVVVSGERPIEQVFAPGFRRDTYLDARGRRNFMRDMSIALGLPGATQLWKLQRFTKIVSDNWDNLTDERWNIFDPTSGALKYRTHPISVLKSLFLPSSDEQEYFAQIKVDSDDITKQREAGRTIQKLLLEGKIEEAKKLGVKSGIRPRLSRRARERRRLTAEERRERAKRRRK